MDCPIESYWRYIVVETNMTLECFIGYPIMPSQDFAVRFVMNACFCWFGKHTGFNTNSSIVLCVIWQLSQTIWKSHITTITLWYFWEEATTSLQRDLWLLHKQVGHQRLDYFDQAIYNWCVVPVTTFNKGTICLSSMFVIAVVHYSDINVLKRHEVCSIV